MPQHPADEQVKRGFTLVEMAVGVAITGIIVMVIAGLFKAGMKSYFYTLRQNFVLENSRKAVQGDGGRHGIIWNAHEAQALALSSGSVALTLPQAPSSQFFLSGQSLFQTQGGTQNKQADGISALQTAYYNMDSQGLIMQSTAPASASMVTALLTMSSSGQRAYQFFSGGKLRNQP